MQLKKLHIVILGGVVGSAAIVAAGLFFLGSDKPAVPAAAQAPAAAAPAAVAPAVAAKPPAPAVPEEKPVAPIVKNDSLAPSIPVKLPTADSPPSPLQSPSLSGPALSGQSFGAPPAFGSNLQPSWLPTQSITVGGQAGRPAAAPAGRTPQRQPAQNGAVKLFGGSVTVRGN
jgi:hypothetical protein